MATAASTEAELHLVAPRQPVHAHLIDIWRFRDLLVNLVRKDLKVRYKNSVLGFLWSMLNPLFLLARLQHRVRHPGRVVLLLHDLAADRAPDLERVQRRAARAAPRRSPANGSLVGKVRFPREILPLAAVGAALVHFFLQSIVLITVLAILRFDVDWDYIWLLPLALVVLIVFAAALAVFLGALNVYARDTGHLLEIVMLAWFWLTPILYGYMLIADKLTEHHINSSILLANPVVPVVITFQRALYGQATLVQDHGRPGHRQERHHGEPAPAPGRVESGGTSATSASPSPIGIALFLLAIKFFDRAEGNFVESL